MAQSWVLNTFWCIVESFLIYQVKNTIDCIWIHFKLFFILFRQFLLWSTMSEVRVVRDQSKIDTVMTQQLIKLLGLGLRPFFWSIFRAVAYSHGLPTFFRGQFRHFVNDSAKSLSREDIAFAAETLAGW